jgi:hypothetical protein
MKQPLDHEQNKPKQTKKNKTKNKQKTTTTTKKRSRLYISTLSVSMHIFEIYCIKRGSLNFKINKNNVAKEIKIKLKFFGF